MSKCSQCGTEQKRAHGITTRHPADGLIRVHTVTLPDAAIELSVVEAVMLMGQLSNWLQSKIDPKYRA